MSEHEAVPRQEREVDLALASQEPAQQPAAQPASVPLAALLTVPSIQEAIAEAIRSASGGPALLGRRRNTEAEVALRTLNFGGWGVLGLLALVILAATVLASLGRMDATSMAFVYGTVIGALLTYASRVLGRGGPPNGA